MSILPYENYYLITRLKPAEVQERLAKETMPDRGVTFFGSVFSQPSGAYFSGFIGDGKFLIKRAISYRNSFLPDISGTIEPWLNGSRLHIKMKMNVVVIVFICIWMSIVGSAGLGMIISEISKKTFDAMVLVPVGMFIFGSALSIGGFKFESSKAKAKFAELLDGEVQGK